MRNLLLAIMLTGASLGAWALVNPVQATNLLWSLANRF
jgi:hypothetical protein